MSGNLLKIDPCDILHIKATLKYILSYELVVEYDNKMGEKLHTV